jgi:uncharacterized membrane protein YhaH (DUF805 family)
VSKGLLDNRRYALAGLCISSAMAVYSWSFLRSPQELSRDPFLLGALAFSIFTMIAISYRSPLLADRLAFGAVAASLLLAVVTRTILLSPYATLIVRGAKSLSWAVIAVVCLVVLVSGTGQKHAKRAPSL